MSNPTYAKVQEGAKLAKENEIDFILAVGGGSVSDCCKIVSAQAKLDEDIWDLEFKKHQFPTEFIPMGVIVTVSGTGSEENNGAVITNEETKQKNGMGGAYADFAILDPVLTRTVPQKQLISGAFDTLSHAMETYFGTPRESFVPNEIAEAIMRNVIKNSRVIVKNPDDKFARSELKWDSTIAENGILKIGKVTDFQAHMLEHQLGTYTNCNHGMGLAAIHPSLYHHIYQGAVNQFARFAVNVWNVPDEGQGEEALALAGIDALEAFIKEIGMPTSLSEMEITDEDLLRKVADSTIITKGCAKQLTADEIFEVLKDAMYRLTFSFMAKVRHYRIQEREEI